MSRRIRAIAHITESIGDMSRTQAAAICASYGWPVGVSETSYSAYLSKLTDSELADLEYAVMSFSGTPAAASSPPLDAAQLKHYLELAEEALEAVAQDADLDQSEAARLLALVGEVASALRAAPSAGTAPVELALTVVVGDLHVHRSTWAKGHSKRWYRIVQGIVTGLVLALGAYTDGKELAQDLGFIAPAPVIAVQLPPTQPDTAPEGP